MKKYVVSLIIGCLLFGIGCAITLVDFYKFNYKNTLPTNKLTSKTITLKETIEDKKFIILSTSSSITKKIDNEVLIGNVKIVINYYNSFTNLEKTYEEYTNYKLVTINTNTNIKDYNQAKDLFNLAVDNLKDKNIYNYSLLFEPNIVVYINEADSSNVKVKNYN